MCYARLVCNNPSQHTEFWLIVAVYIGTLYSKELQAPPHARCTAFAKMLVCSALYNVNERKTFAANDLRESICLIQMIKQWLQILTWL